MQPPPCAVALTGVSKALTFHLLQHFCSRAPTMQQPMADFIRHARWCNNHFHAGLSLNAPPSFRHHMEAKCCSYSRSICIKPLKKILPTTDTLASVLNTKLEDEKKNIDRWELYSQCNDSCRVSARMPVTVDSHHLRTGMVSERADVLCRVNSSSFVWGETKVSCSFSWKQLHY